MGKAVRVHKTGGPEVLEYEDFDPGHPGPGEIRIRHDAIGLNFIDVYHRTGLYPLPELPGIPGMEGAGVVVAVGEGVTAFREGERVAYAGAPPGAYADERCIPAHRVVRLPEAVTTETAAAMMLKGMTARYLLRGCYPVKKGDTILIHAAAGGVGSIVCQWASNMGAVVIGTVGSKEKARRIRERGCRYPIDYNKTDFVAAVKEITGGKGVDVVYDSVGQATLLKSMDCLRPMGTLVSFGQASGAVPPMDIGILAAKGSLFLTRPSLMTYTATREDLTAHADDLFEAVISGAVKIDINQTYALADVVAAHRDLEGRKTTGATILVP